MNDVPPPPDAIPPTDADLWVIVLRPLPSEVPDAIRIRHLLKRALRDWGLKCVSVRDPTAAELLAAADTNPTTS